MWRMLFLTALFCFAVLGTDAHGFNLRSHRKRDAGSHGPDFNYEEDHGPATWKNIFPQCDGKRQSPVNIVTKKLDINDDLDEIDFNNYDEVLENAYMRNNGHTVAVFPGKDDSITIEDGGLDDQFQFVSLHFHWGSDSTKGSEHTIDGKKFPLEMHLVHKNKNYDSIDDALKIEDGLAVLGVLFKVSEKRNQNLDPIIKKLEQVKSEKQEIPLDDFKLEDLLPDDLMPYYRYEGSLTTPNCDEAVIWTVFKDLVPISEEQLKKFRSLKEKDTAEAEETLVNNFRPTQPIGNRKIEMSGKGNGDTDDHDQCSHSNHSSPSATTMTIVLLGLVSTLISSRHF